MIEGKRGRGRRWIRLLDRIKENKLYVETRTKRQDRDEWRVLNFALKDPPLSQKLVMMTTSFYRDITSFVTFPLTF